MEQATLNAINNKLDFLIYRDCGVSNEVLSKEAEEAVREGLEAHRRGELSSWEEVKKELGLQDA